MVTVYAVATKGIKLVITSALIFFCALLPARADWAFTKWGMTLRDTLIASNGQANVLPPQDVKGKSTFKGSTCKANIKDYNISEYHFEVVFCFDSNDRLSSVVLYTSGDEFRAIDRALTATYGAPASQKGGSLPSKIWNDRQGGNTLRLIRVSSTVIEYKAIPTGF